MVHRFLAPVLAFGLATLVTFGDGQTQDRKDDKKAEKKALPNPPVPPTAANVAYGPLERQVLDFFQAKSDKPTPVAFCVHGGGWSNGDKSSYYSRVKAFNDAGISLVTINYRLMAQANAQKVTPPVKAPLEDAARALQFVRSKASEWNIDKKRIGATGGSAGGCSSLWLAFHDDMADPKSSDPIARESTRLYCAAVDGAQVTLDPKVVRGWMPGYTYGAHAFGMKNLDEVEKNRDMLAAWIKEYSPITHVTKDDPPIGLYFGTGKRKLPDGKEGDDFTHSPVLGQKLAEKLKETGVEVVLSTAAEPNKELPTSTAFLIHYLKK
jgi:acetyl esterase/lipase